MNQDDDSHDDGVRRSLISLIDRAQRALLVIGSDPCSELLEAMSHDLFMASSRNRWIVANKLKGARDADT